MIHRAALMALLAIGLIAVVTAAPQTVITNKTYVLNPPGTTPFNIWAGAAIIGLLLLLVSFLKFPSGEEGLISIVAWIPIGFAMLTSFAVDRITSTGYSMDAAGTPILIEIHTVSNYSSIAIALLILLVFAIGNTYRIWITQNKNAEPPQVSWHDRHGGTL